MGNVCAGCLQDSAADDDRPPSSPSKRGFGKLDDDNSEGSAAAAKGHRDHALGGVAHKRDHSLREVEEDYEIDEVTEAYFERLSATKAKKKRGTGGETKAKKEDLRKGSIFVQGVQMVEHLLRGGKGGAEAVIEEEEEEEEGVEDGEGKEGKEGQGGRGKHKEQGEDEFNWNTVYFKGWLHKKGGTGGGRRNWKRRWFELRGATLNYFEDDGGEGAPKGMVGLVGCCVEDVPDAKAGRFQFQISSLHGGAAKEKPRQFYSDELGECRRWVEVITKVIVAANDHNDSGLKRTPSFRRGARKSLVLKQEGYLYKKGAGKMGLQRGWKRRYFQLRRNELYYYTTEGADYPKGVIDLNGTMVRRTKGGSKKELDFQIAHMDRQVRRRARARGAVCVCVCVLYGQTSMSTSVTHTTFALSSHERLLSHLCFHSPHTQRPTHTQ